MNQPTTVKLPFYSRVLIDCESHVVGKWQLPTQGARLFESLPECTHDRHAEIRKRLIHVWKTPVAEHLCDRLRGPLDQGAMLLHERLQAWHLALKTTANPTETNAVAECLAEFERVLFSERGVEQMMTRTIGHLFKETRNYKTNYWSDKAYRKLTERLSIHPQSIVTHLLGLTEFRSRMTSAIAKDAASYGLQVEMPSFVAKHIHEQPLPGHFALAI